MKIKAFNAKTYKLLIENGLISDYVDIFDLAGKREQMLSIKGLGEKKVNLLLEEIELSRRSSFEQVLNAMQYLALGNKACKEISKHFKTLDEFLSHSAEEIKSKAKSLNEPAVKSLDKLLNSEYEIARLKAVASQMKGDI